MADRSHLEADRGDDTGVEPSRRSGTDTPRWVKVSGVIALLLVVLVVVLALRRRKPRPRSTRRWRLE
jgi:hypothetical protein